MPAARLFHQCPVRGRQPVLGRYFFRSAGVGSRKSLSLPFLREPSSSFKVISGGHPNLASSTLSTTPTAREILWTIVSPRYPSPVSVFFALPMGESMSSPGACSSAQRRRPRLYLF